MLLIPLYAAETGGSPVQEALQAQLTAKQSGRIEGRPSLERMIRIMSSEQRVKARDALLSAAAGTQDPAVLLEIARGLELLNAPEETARVARRLQESAPDSEDGFRLAALARVRLKDYAGAAAEAREWLRRAPESPQAKDILALTASRAGASPPTQPSAPQAPPARARAFQQLKPAERKRPPAEPPAPAGEDLRARVSEALELLRKSPTGRELARFIAEQRIEIKPSKALRPDAAAQYDSRSKAILLPPEAARRDPRELAVSIGHEAHHAVQSIQKKMEPSIEAELGANFVDRVIYHELIQAGVPRLPEVNWVEENYSVFLRQMKGGKHSNFEESVRRGYSESRRRLLDLRTRDTLRMLRPLHRRWLE